MKDDTIYVGHILDAIDQIKEFTLGYTQDSFLKDKKTCNAVVRCFEIMGEATKRLSIPFREMHSEIPWKKIAGMRDVLIHDYMGTDFFAVWRIVENQLPQLEIQLRNSIVQK